jgi:hypothetical protein
MSATTHALPHARHVTPSQRAGLLLGMAADAARHAADASGQVPDRLRADMLAAMAAGDLGRVVFVAAQLSGHVGAQSA